ncbi:hypothetical protein H2248_001939 [Termitomyces sp. 'cryptogamus']|nr:hypothetical protein H2248_001939 [Termitomyces sp. 'cryptogamus']
MPNWIDIFSLTLTLSLISSIVYAILLVSRQVSESITSTQENLKNKGYTISREGMSVKTAKRFDRSDYVDVTQRGFVKAYGAASFGKDNLGSASHQESNTKRNGR